MYTKEQFINASKFINSQDYKERFIAEYIQLKYRYERLQNMIENWDNGTLPFKPTCHRNIYNYQIKAMKEYLDVLEIRAQIENVNLHA